MMEHLKRQFASLKLNSKFTLVIFGVVLVPVVLLAAVLFGNMRSVMIEDKIKDLETALLKTQSDLDKAVDLCNLTTQYFLNNPGLIRFLTVAKSEEDLTSDHLIDFYRHDIYTMEKLVNVNPYLYQVRVYQPNETVPEIMPILYHESRMKRLAWQDSWQSGQWQLDYDDTIFPSVVLQPARHIMSMTTSIEAYQSGSLGVLEVALRMDEVLPGLYSGISCDALFAGGTWYTGERHQAFWELAGPAVAGQLEAINGPGTTYETELAGEQVLLSFVPLSSIGGHYVSVVFLSDVAAGLTLRRNMFFMLTGLSLLLVVFTVNYISKTMLRRFYVVMDTVTQVGAGDLDVVVPDLGHDEVGTLAEQIDRMLSRIRSLLQENVEREVAAKNAEIKALQGQINAHFIYNVLESIKMMAEVDGRFDIADAITSLGKLMRYSMRWNTQLVTVEEEVENVENYLSLMNLRYDYQIRLVTELPEALAGKKIPKMILQPLVENAVAHGIEPLARDTTIFIGAATLDDTTCAIDVVDEGQGIDPETLARLQELLDAEAGTGSGDGIGLKNVRDRIVISYGPEYGLTIESEHGKYTRVRLILPL